MGYAIDEERRKSPLKMPKLGVNSGKKQKREE